MNIVKWKRPSENDQAKRPVMYNYPLSGLFENFFGGDFFLREYAQFVPAANLSEDQKQYQLELSAPGFDRSDFKIELDEKTLTVSGKHTSEKEAKAEIFSRKEFNYGSFSRIFSLPKEINEAAIDAKYENGILKVNLPKKEESKSTTKEIKIS
jgi:HSP20 family protein